MAKTYKVSTVEVSAQSRKEWLARKRGKGEVVTSAAAVVVQSEASSAPSALDAFFRQVNIGTDDAPKYVAEALFPLRIGDALLDWHADQKYLGVEHATKSEKANFFATGGVSCGGIGSSSGGGTGGGGTSTLSGLNDVALKSAIANDMLVYNGTHWVNTPMSAIKPDLTAYATKSWVEDKGYALNTALLKVDARLANVETIFEADQDGAINKWSEVVAFLDGIEGDTLDNILSQFATQKWVEGNYLPIDGTAKNAEKLGGEEPDHYATADALSTLSKAVTEFRSLFDSFFEKDTANNAIKAKLSLYSLGGVTAGGIGSSSGVSSEGGSSTLAGLNDVLLKSAIANDMLVYNGTHWVNTPMSAIKPDLTAYATKSWVEGKGYITASALDPYAKTADVANTYATQTALQGVDLRVQAIEYIFEKDNDGVINKWSEIVDFLAGVEGTTLDSILDQFLQKSGGAMTGELELKRTSGANRTPAIKFTDNYWTGYLYQSQGELFWGHNNDASNDNKIIDWSNIGNYALKLSGGTLTGDITIKGTNVNGFATRLTNNGSVVVEVPSFSALPIGGWSRGLSVYNKEGATSRQIAAAFGGSSSGYEFDYYSGTYDNHALQLRLSDKFATFFGGLKVMGSALFRNAMTLQGDGFDVMLKTKNSSYELGFGCGSGGTNRGIYDYTNDSWWIYRDANVNTYIPQGNVGIGTTTPTSKLHVEGGARITDSTTIEKNLFVDKNIYIAESSSDGGIYFGDDDYAFIKETPDDVMTIASNQGLILRVNHISDEGAVIKLDGPVRIGDAILSWDATNKCVTIKNANTGEKAGFFVDGGVTGTAIN